VAEFERIITARWDTDGAEGIKGYEKTGGYQGLKKALDTDPADLIEMVKNSGLRGRGGAGFPTGMKWGFIPQDTGKPIYVVVNADEGEPGTFKDRELMERDPFLLLEGMAVTGLALGVPGALAGTFLAGKGPAAQASGAGLVTVGAATGKLGTRGRRGRR
jgi:NADH-quinone oxidoreductase subunit F